MQVEFEGKIYEFPDDITDQEIATLLAQQTKAATPTPTKEEPVNRSYAEEALRQLGLTGRMAVSAFTAPATTVLDALSGAYNLGAEAAGSKTRMPSFSGQQSQMMTQLGVPEPASGLERAIQTGGEAGFGAAGMAKALPKVPAFAKEVGKQITGATVAGTAAQPAAEIVKEATGSDLAAFAAALATGALAASGTSKALNTLKKGEVPIYSVEEIKKRASQNYRKVDNLGIQLKPDSVAKLGYKIEDALSDARMIQGTEEANAINARLDQLQTIIDSNSPLPFGALEKIRGSFNDLKTSKDANIRRLAGTAVGQIDLFISNLSGKEITAGAKGVDEAVKTIRTARQDWKNQAKANLLQDTLDIADARSLDPKASESELIRRGFINIAADKNKMNLFSKDEQGVIRKVANGGSLDKVLSFAAQFSPLRSKLAAAGSGVAAVSNPSLALAIGGGGMAADIIQGALRRQAAEQAVKTIASGAARPAPQDLRLQGSLAGGMFTDLE